MAKDKNEATTAKPTATSKSKPAPRRDGLLKAAKDMAKRNI